MDLFDYKQYISNYPDLQHLNEQGAIKHYNIFGKKEGRTDKKKIQVDFNNCIISGEKIQLMCDYFIGTKEDIMYNPVIYSEVSKYPWKWIDLFTKNPIQIQNEKLLKIFCYTWIPGNHLILLKGILLQIKQSFLLYFHNSDGNFLQHHYNTLNVPNCKQIYSQNNTVPQVTTLPIGQANSQWKHGNVNLLLESMKSIKKNNLIA